RERRRGRDRAAHDGPRGRAVRRRHAHPPLGRASSVGAAPARAQVLLRRDLRRRVRPADGLGRRLRSARHRKADHRRRRDRHGRGGPSRRRRPEPHPERLLSQLRVGLRGRRRRRGGDPPREGKLMTLTALWLMPLVGGVLVAFLPPPLAKWMGALVAAVALLIAAFVAFNFAPGYHGFQFTEKLAWIPQLSIFYRLGVDGISLWLLVLNAFLTLIAIFATPVTKRTGGFVGLMLAMSAGLAGVFMATDLVLFYVFWEAMLIPAYFLLWLYGEGSRPGYAALKFVLYTLAGSLLMLVGVIGEYVATGKQTFDLARLAKLTSSPSIQVALSFVFALAFAIKTPLFPFH